MKYRELKQKFDSPDYVMSFEELRRFIKLEKRKHTETISALLLALMLMLVCLTFMLFGLDDPVAKAAVILGYMGVSFAAPYIWFGMRLPMAERIDQAEVELMRREREQRYRGS